MSCSDYECGIALFDTSSGEMLHCEMFELLQEGRNKADYVVSPDGKWVSHPINLIRMFLNRVCTWLECVHCKKFELL